MSFLRKLFRKDTTSRSAKGRPTRGASKHAPGEQPDVNAERELQQTEHDQANTAATATSNTPADKERTQTPENDGDADWWKASVPVSDTTPTPEPASTIETPDSSTPALVSPAPPGETPERNAVSDANERNIAAQNTDPKPPEHNLHLHPMVAAVEGAGTRSLTDTDAPKLAALRSHRGLAAAALRDKGRVRAINQDSIFSLITTLPRESNDVAMGLFIVADGMGGHDGGEIASRLAISTVVHYVLSELVVPALDDEATEVLQPLVIAAVQEANRAIWEHAQSINSDMGTTCTVALLLGQALYIAHVGDSRAYLVTPTGLNQITNDHSTVGRLIQLGQLDPSEAREHPLRSQLYRTVGQQSEVAVDFIYQPIGGATHLFVCSDGLWSMLDEEVLLDVMEHTIWPQDACHELVARANLAGGEDNISVVVVSLPTQ